MQICRNANMQITPQTIEKLKLLANNTYDLVNVLMARFMDDAANHDHKMGHIYQSFGRINDFRLHSSTCEECGFGVWVSHTTDDGIRFSCNDFKCPGEK
jgi:hypothetical protein